MIFFQNFPHEFVLCVVNGLDDEAIVFGIVKETATFAGRAKLG
jgi:hypothetical protein